MKNLTIFNLRSGFANNSSSTHSVIFFPPETDTSNMKSDCDSDFGWQNFTLSDIEDKKHYLLATLKGNIEYDLNSSYLSAILNSWCDTDLSDDDIEHAYVDHQSLITLPRTFDGTAVHQDYFNEIQKILLASNTVIIGGNDNDDGNPTFEKHSQFAKRLDDVFETEGPVYTAKFDSIHQYWTLFNRFNGNKIRMTFTKEGTVPVIPVKAETPDLVDVKITDFCAFGCAFCYQGSTTNGKHTSLFDIETIIRCLAENEVFEIAYGGGEPTQHPDFVNIITKTREHHIIPNFTTKNMGWLKKNLWEIKDIFGSFAYSISYKCEVEKLASIREFYEIENHRVAVQLVMGTMSLNSILDIIEECVKYRMPITLLGFKTQERGIGFSQYPYEGWLAAVKNLKDAKGLHNLKLGIDTALVQQSEAELIEAKIPEFMYHRDEGMFSWYIDAVAKKHGPSSYAKTSPYQSVFRDFYPAYTAYQA